MIYEPIKRCKRCLRDLSLSAFYAHRQMADGHLNICIECTKARINNKRASDPDLARQKDKERYVRDHQRIRERSNGYNAENPQKNRDRVKKWQNENPEKVREQRKRTYAKSRDKILQQHRDYYKRNPDALARLRKKQRQYITNNPTYYNITSQKRRARKRSLPDTYTQDDWFYALDYWQSRCAYCGNPPGLFPGMELTADHFIAITDPRPDNPGTVPGNMLPACRSCNSIKSKRDPVVFAELQFGKRRAKQVLARIAEFFEHLRARRA